MEGKAKKRATFLGVSKKNDELKEFDIIFINKP
jgi:hypothetical protein